MKPRLVNQIAESGPWPFERFMEQVLYHPEEGFFAAGPIRSQAAGDFLTSPEVSPAFGMTLAGYVEQEWHRLGHPDDFTIMEVGAGSGSLLGPLLEALSFRPQVVAVEKSATARHLLQQRFPEAAVVSAGEEPAQLRGVVFANEVVDNCAVALAVHQGGGWSERWVGSHGGELVLVEAPVRPPVGEWLARYGGGTPEGGVVEVQLAAQAWLGEMIGRLQAGSLVIVDFGSTTAGLAERRQEGTLRTYRGHRLGPHPLVSPGEADLTADVNFSALLDTAQRAGLDCQLLSQREFLIQLGLEVFLSDLRYQEREAAGAGETMRQLQLRNDLTGAKALLQPSGLGDFQVLVARTPSPF